MVTVIRHVSSVNNFYSQIVMTTLDLKTILVLGAGAWAGAGAGLVVGEVFLLDQKATILGNAFKQFMN